LYKTFGVEIEDARGIPFPWLSTEVGMIQKLLMYLHLKFQIQMKCFKCIVFCLVVVT